MIVIALLAIVRTIISLDLSTLDATKLAPLAAAMLALGAEYWLGQSAAKRPPAS